jgi:predicted dehydrogenase
VLTLGIIGLGRAGEQQAAAACSTEGLAVTALYDPLTERASRVASTIGSAAVASSVDELVNSPKVDAVIVASPDHLHREHTIAALNAGKHVLCEKPMASSMSDCKAMVEASERTGRRLMIGHLVRFTPVFEDIKRLVDAGTLGDIYYVGADYQHDYERLGGWRFDPRISRHLFLGGGCHAVDLARWFTTDLTQVSAAGNHIALPQLPNDDCTIAMYRSRTSQLARVFVSGGCKRPYQIGLEVYGTRGTAVATNVDPTYRIWHADLSAGAPGWLTTPVRASDNHPFGRQLAHFAQCLKNDTSFIVDGVEGMKTVAAALAVIEGSRSGETQIIDVP